MNSLPKLPAIEYSQDVVRDLGGVRPHRGDLGVVLKSVRVDPGRDLLVGRAEREVVDVLDAGERVVRSTRANASMPASSTLRGIAVQ